MKVQVKGRHQSLIMRASWEKIRKNILEPGGPLEEIDPVMKLSCQIDAWVRNKEGSVQARSPQGKQYVCRGWHFGPWEVYSNVNKGIFRFSIFVSSPLEMRARVMSRIHGKAQRDV